MTDPLTPLMMLLGPAPGPVTDIDAAYPWPEADRWVRAMMVTTLDGAAAGPDELSGSISGDADQAVFNATRRYADAVLVGAGTFRDEGYTPLKTRDAAVRERRLAAGQAEAPVLAIVSRSLDFDWESPTFADSDIRPIVLAPDDAEPEAVARAEKHCDLVRTGTGSAENIIDALVARGLTRIVCEGGPTLLSEIAARGMLDEADITVSPMLVGTRHTPNTPAIDLPVRLHLAHVIAGDDFLMNRYLTKPPKDSA